MTIINQQEQLFNDIQSVKYKILCIAACFQNDLIRLHKDGYIEKEQIIEQGYTFKTTIQQTILELQSFSKRGEILLNEIVKSIN